MHVAEKDLKSLSTIQNMRKQNWFVKVVSLIDGNSFGELSIINEAPRAATVICESSQLIVAVFKKENYKKIFQKIQLRLIEEETKFFRNISFVKNWSNQQIQKLVVSFAKKDFIRGQYVIKQGDLADMVYFIHSGDFESVRQRKIKPMNFHHCNYSQFLGSNLPVDKRPKPISIKQRHPNSVLGLQIYNIGILFGYQDVIQKRNYSHSVKCSSQTGVLYEISAQ